MVPLGWDGPTTLADEFDPKFRHPPREVGILGTFGRRFQKIIPARKILASSLTHSYIFRMATRCRLDLGLAR